MVLQRHGVNISSKEEANYSSNTCYFSPLEIAIKFGQNVESSKFLLKHGAKLPSNSAELISSIFSETNAQKIHDYLKVARAADELYYKSHDISLKLGTGKDGTIKFMLDRIENLYKADLKNSNANDRTYNFEDFLENHAQDNGIFDSLKSMVKILAEGSDAHKNETNNLDAILDNAPAELNLNDNLNDQATDLHTQNLHADSSKDIVDLAGHHTDA
jgi:hypothetical protein